MFATASLGERVVEEHVGKKRRKEVRQAINMSEELRSSLVYIWSVLGGGCLITLVFTYLAYANILPIDDAIMRFLPLGFMLVVICIITPRASRYWSLRDQYKSHLARFNISKDDMRALKNDEL